MAGVPDDRDHVTVDHERLLPSELPDARRDLLDGFRRDLPWVAGIRLHAVDRHKPDFTHRVRQDFRHTAVNVGHAVSLLSGMAAGKWISELMLRPRNAVPAGTPISSP